MLRTCPVRLPAIRLTLSRRSFQTHPTPGPSACPPSLRSVPPARPTRRTPELNERSWLTIELTVRAVSRNWPWSVRPSISRGIVCDRSPLATALMTRDISLFGRTRSSIRLLSEFATFPPWPVQSGGIRAVKSPRWIAVRTLSVTRGSIVSLALTSDANCRPSLDWLHEIRLSTFCASYLRPPLRSSLPNFSACDLHVG